MSDVDLQIKALESGVLVRPMPQLATILLSGDDRQSWLNGMLTCDVAKLAPGQGAYGLSVQKNGRLQAEVWAVFAEEQIVLGVYRDLAESTQIHLDGYLIMEDAELEVPSSPWLWWLAYGPKCDVVAARAREGGATVGRMHFAELDTAIIAGPEQVMSPLGESLLSFGDTVLATAAGWERIRIERMLPVWGADFDQKNYPQEASLEGLAVSFNKGCYLGQEAVFMLQKRGHVAKRLVRLVVGKGLDLQPGDEVNDKDGKKVGHITSAVRDGDTTFAMAMVRYKQTASGTDLSVANESAVVSCLSRENSCG